MELHNGEPALGGIRDLRIARIPAGHLERSRFLCEHPLHGVRTWAATEADVADGGQLMGPKGAMLGLQLVDGPSDHRGKRSRGYRRFGGEQAGHSLSIE